jgi:hypothetical protein
VENFQGRKNGVKQSNQLLIGIAHNKSILTPTKTAQKAMKTLRRTLSINILE